MLHAASNFCDFIMIQTDKRLGMITISTKRALWLCSQISRGIGSAALTLFDKGLSFWFQNSLWPCFWKHDRSSFSQFYSSLVTYFRLVIPVLSSPAFFFVYKSVPLSSVSLGVYIAHVSDEAAWVLDKCSSGLKPGRQQLLVTLLFNQSPFYSHLLHVHLVERAFFCIHNGPPFSSLPKQNMTFMSFQLPLTFAQSVPPQTCLPWSPWGREPRGRSHWLGQR